MLSVYGGKVGVQVNVAGTQEDSSGYSSIDQIDFI